MMNRILVVAFACLALTGPTQAAPAGAPPAAKVLLDDVREARAARLAGNYQAWRDAVSGALEIAPDHPDLLLSAARAEAALGNADAALQRLGDAIQRGAGFDPSEMHEFDKLSRRSAFRVLAQQARANATPSGHAVEFAQLPRHGQSEGIAYDPLSRRLFAGNAQGEIFAIDENGAVSTFVPQGSGLREVYGLKVDARRGVLWAATAVFPDLVQRSGAPAKPDVGLSGLVAFSLTDGNIVAASWLNERPALHGFNDIALAANGDVYVTDSAAGAIYVLRDGEGTIEPFVTDPKFSFPNGIVIAPDQHYLIVATVEGLARIDLATREVRRLGVPATVSVNSIDGLVWDGADLIGVQGSPFLARVVRIRLDAQLENVNLVEVLNARTPREYGFTTAALAGDQLYVIGGSPMADSAGKPLAAEASPQIVRLPLATGRYRFVERVFQ